MKAWIFASVPCFALACGGSFVNDTSSHNSSSVDGGDTGGSSAGGSSGAGGSPAGGKGGGLVGTGGAISAGGREGAGGFVIAGGTVGAGGLTGAGGGIDCSNVGCAAPPICTDGCSAPCGCCACADGAHQTFGSLDYVCSGGCFAPIAQPVDGGVAHCTYNGATYGDGETFRAGEGCNTCMCTGGNYGCTKMACVCDPASETHQREYIGTDPSQCAVIDFACQANTTMFQNACGCGCEQGISCPDWFNCMPGPGQSCDTNQIKTQCPYSGIAF